MQQFPSDCLCEERVFVMLLTCSPCMIEPAGNHLLHPSASSTMNRHMSLYNLADSIWRHYKTCTVAWQQKDPAYSSPFAAQQRVSPTLHSSSQEMLSSCSFSIMSMRDHQGLLRRRQLLQPSGKPLAASPAAHTPVGAIPCITRRMRCKPWHSTGAAQEQGARVRKGL